MVAVVIAAGLVPLTGVPAKAEARAVVVCPPANSLSGVDVSQDQGVINWTQVANAGYSFGYARVGDGSAFPDVTFQTNFSGMKSAGLKPGGYLFFEPGQDPHAQANALLSALSQAHFAPGDLIPALDVAVTGGQSSSTIVANLQAAVNDIKAALGVAPVIYTFNAFWQNNVNSSAFGGDPLWIASYGVACPNTPQGWSTWALWQYTNQGSVPGIATPTDLDRSFGTNLPVYAPPPSLTIAKSHTGNFTPGRHGVYTLTVANSAGTTVGPTDGTAVTVSDMLPKGLTPVSIAGMGWSCTLATVTCTRSDVLPAGQSYPSITLKVNVRTAPGQVTNTATVTGGGDSATHTATDPTTISRRPGPHPGPPYPSTESETEWELEVGG